MKITVTTPSGSRIVDEEEVGFDEHGNFHVGDTVYTEAVFTSMQTEFGPSDVVKVTDLHFLQRQTPEG